jgi:hypothetical protein
MQTTLIGGKRHSGQQLMGETREPMSSDCWNDAQNLAEKYAEILKKDFWILYAAKPHTRHGHAIVAGWDIQVKRPPSAMVGVLTFRWCHAEKRLVVEPELCLPYDVPISEAEMSKKSADYFPSMASAAKKSGGILLA